MMMRVIIKGVTFLEKKTIFLCYLKMIFQEIAKNKYFTNERDSLCSPNAPQYCITSDACVQHPPITRLCTIRRYLLAWCDMAYWRKTGVLFVLLVNFVPSDEHDCWSIAAFTGTTSPITSNNTAITA